MTLLPSLRLTTHLNALVRRRIEVGVAAAAVVGEDVAHHVVDPETRLGLDPVAATPLADALPALVSAEPELWVLALPIPGRLTPLRGPRELNAAAVEAGSAVVGASGTLALVPHPVGRAVQWRVFPAERPFSPATPYEAERTLNETVIGAAAALARLDVAAGTRPAGDRTLGLAPGYHGRQHASAARAARLLQSCTVALNSDGGSLSSYEVEARDRQLRLVRDAAIDALSAAATWVR